MRVFTPCNFGSEDLAIKKAEMVLQNNLHRNANPPIQNNIRPNFSDGGLNIVRCEQGFSRVNLTK